MWLYPNAVWERQQADRRTGVTHWDWPWRCYCDSAASFSYACSFAPSLIEALRIQADVVSLLLALSLYIKGLLVPVLLPSGFCSSFIEVLKWYLPPTFTESYCSVVCQSSLCVNTWESTLNVFRWDPSVSLLSLQSPAFLFHLWQPYHLLLWSWLVFGTNQHASENTSLTVVINMPWVTASPGNHLMILASCEHQR